MVANRQLLRQCNTSAGRYYGGVRTAHWPPGTSATLIVLGTRRYETTAEANSVAANPNYIVNSAFANRPLPINYLSFGDKPLAPQNIARLPTNKALPVKLISANLLSTNGALPIGTSWSHYYRTNHLRVKANYPAHVSTSPTSSCPSRPGTSWAYFTDSSPRNPFPTNGNRRTERSLYLKLCAEHTEHTDHTTELLELEPVEAKLVENSYGYNDGDRLRHYQNVTAKDLTASLSPNPETLTLLDDGTWSGRITVNGTSNLPIVRVNREPRRHYAVSGN